jgi:hypothetical protein
MTNREQLIRDVEHLPESLVPEILDLVRALRARKAGPCADTTFASEEVLAKDWLRPEEDEAWKEL